MTPKGLHYTNEVTLRRTTNLCFYVAFWRRQKYCHEVRPVVARAVDQAGLTDSKRAGGKCLW